MTSCHLLRVSVAFVALLVPTVAKITTISNLEPKYDTKGNIVNAHDGTLRKIGDYFYYHGAEYGLCREPPKLGCDQTPDHCGFHGDHNVSIYRSRDLSSGSWEFVGRGAKCAELPGCEKLFRPHLVFNPNTQNYTLFVNYVRKGGAYGGNAVYTSPSPEGPFELRNPSMNLTRLCPGPAAQEPCGEAQGGAGDFDVFVDDDGAGYLAYGSNFYMSIEQLTPDFLQTTGQNASAGGEFGGTVFPDYFVEASSMFKRNGTYYLLYGHCCCFCYQGSGIMVYTAQHPMGPWEPQTDGAGSTAVDLACRSATDAPHQTLEWLSLGAGAHSSGEPTPDQGCLYGGAEMISTTRAQQNVIMEVPLVGGQSALIWTGDRWQQSPDGIKGHEGQFWAPLSFDASGKIEPVDWIDEFDLDIDIETPVLPQQPASFV